MRAPFRSGVVTGAGLANEASPDPIHELARALTQCHRMPEAFTAIERSFTAATGFPSAIFLPELDHLCVPCHSPEFNPDRSDLANASESISSGRRVDNCDAASDACRCFLPLITWKGALGAFAFRAPGSPARISHDQWALIEAFASQTALAVLRGTLEDEARDPQVLADADKLQKIWLNSIAHNVRTPLSSVIGVLSTLQEEGIDQPVRRDLIDTARQEAERLNRVVGNLLDLSRLEAGALRIRKDACDVQDVIGAALEQLGLMVTGRQVDVVLPADMAFVPMDFVLIVQVLVNLLENAIKYSPPGLPITVEAHVRSERLQVSVSDLGPGIAESDLCRVFEKFNRGKRTGETGGVGLGLSICKGLIEAHHGEIWAERRSSQGTRVIFTLPV